MTSHHVTVRSDSLKYQRIPHPCCPFVTRARLLTVSTVSLVSTLFLLVQCMYPGLLQQHRLLCCRRGDVIRMVYEEEANRAAAAASRNNISRERNNSNVRNRHAKRRLPQCLIIGVRKGGTRALLEFLSLHPDVQAEKQEMHFFDDDQNYGLGLDWYRKKMRYSDQEQITIEKTPAYFVGERVPERVHQMNSSIRLLLTVRDPIERAISDYMQIHTTRLDRGKYHARFEDLAIDPVTGDVNRSYKAIRRSIYHRHLERWLEHFRLEQFHFVSSENLVRNPVDELRKVESFLGLGHRLSEDRFYFNKTRGFYCMRGGPNRPEKCLASSKGRPHPNIDPTVMKKLRSFFQPHNARFYKMVGAELGWQ